MSTQKTKCEDFARLHREPGAFLIPNPWDVGSAKLLEGLGFKALATTSAGFAYTLAKTDGEVTLEEKVAHCAAVVAATSIPVNADFENGFADAPEAVAANVLRVAKTGVAGCSIEDFGRDSHAIYDFNLAVERIQAAAETAATLGMPFQLTARAENLLRGIDDLDDTIRRLKAYEVAGADVLYAPAIKSLDVLRQVTAELRKPFNALAVFFPGATIDELAAAGAKRISVGSGLAWASLSPLIKAGKEMLERGTFAWTTDMVAGADLRRLLRGRTPS
ncbi:MAG TPA: isocitrate lyase/phosphoenolpyruvate mutase family protein [Candidatus Binatia bacterium]|nr:isocitrate lyase/phosphoenolpyruvate mutase family protein [Candidatus Binatia bacterium]